MSELTLVLNFHREGHYALVAIKSANEAMLRARASGREVSLACVLDRPDVKTLEAVRGSDVDWTFAEEVDNGDLGKSRNDAVTLVDSDAVGFMDGDDLCGDEWIAKALSVFDSLETPAILHPEYIYYFDESDFLLQSQGISPAPSVKSFWLHQIGSDDRQFDPEVLRFNNVYTSNTIAPREVFGQYPFLEVDSEKGFGVEDWTWNALTLARGIPHLVVPETVHMVRVKESSSLGKDNTLRGLLPDLTSAFGEGK